MIELARAGQSWEGEVSCREVSTVTGDTRYFFLALDPDGEIVAGSGTPEWPHVATIVGALPNGPEALPGEAPPVCCHDPADCPPDFPGCPRYAFRRPPCHSDANCAEGHVCAWDGYCGAPSLTVPAGPTDEDDEERLAAAVRAVTKRYKKKVAANR
jgi:hypothetical protein